jgi:hypothetical protein
MTLHSKGVVWYTDGSRVTRRPGADVFGLRPMKKLSFHFCVCHSVSFRKSVTFACAKESIGKAYIDELMHICSGKQAGLFAIKKASRMTLKLTWECQQAMCILPTKTRVTLLSSHRFRVIRMQIYWLQGN